MQKVPTYFRGIAIVIANSVVLLIAASQAVGQSAPWQQAPDGSQGEKPNLNWQRKSAVSPDPTEDEPASDPAPDQVPKRKASPKVRVVSHVADGSASAELQPTNDPPSDSPSNLSNQTHSRQPLHTMPEPIQAGPPEPVAMQEDGEMEYGGNGFNGDDNEDYTGPSGMRYGSLREFMYGNVHHRVYAETEYLAWWTKGSDTPPLLTSGGTAAILGETGTAVLYGDDQFSGGFRSGQRITAGTWINPCETAAIEVSYLYLGTSRFPFNSTGSGPLVLARPFYDVSGGSASSVVLASTGQTGTFSSSSLNKFEEFDSVFRRGLIRSCDYKLDVLVGYRSQELYDDLTIDSSTTLTAAGLSLQSHDEFKTQNFFNGPEIGFDSTFQRDRWSFETLVKLALGDNFTRVTIDGATTSMSATTTLNFPGGILALPSNSGVHTSNQFSVVPELGAKLGFDVNSHLRLNCGYTIIYESNVARPGEQIDTNVDPRQFPPPTTTTALHPAFQLHTTDYWTQGINAGIEYRF